MDRKSRLGDLALWEGDRIFLRLLDSGEPFFSLKLEYAGQRLTRAVKNGRDLPLPAAAAK